MIFALESRDECSAGPEGQMTAPRRREESERRKDEPVM